MIVDTVLKNSKIWYQDNLIEYGLAINDGKIVSISKETSLPEADEKINCNGNIILPGMTDIHVHFREPGLTHKGTWETESKAALKGGITYIIDMPNTLPPTITLKRVFEKKRIAKKYDINFGLYGGINEENIPMIQELSKHVKAFKIFMGKSTGNLILDKHELLVKAFSELSKADKIACVHAEDQKTIEKISKKYKNKEDPLTQLLLRPPEVEINAIKEAISIAKQTNTKLHICHLSTKVGLEVIKKAKKEGMNISCETCPHYFLMNQDDFLGKGSLLKANPPLRTKENQLAILRGINDGSIDILVTDHAPHTLEEKKLEIHKAPSGMPSVENSLQLMLDLVNKRIVEFKRMVELMHDNPGKSFDLNDYGYIQKGNIANLTIVDMKKEWKIKRDNVVSKAGWSPYKGWQGKGLPTHTVINGRILNIE
jgi:dihydroorotase